MNRTMNKTNSILKEAFEKGYRIINNEVIYKTNTIKKILSIRGYHTFAVRSKTGERYGIDVHRLVAFQKFGDKIFEPGIHVRHKDNNKLNNHPDNLLLGTASENAMDLPEEDRKKRAIYATSFCIKHNAEKIKKRRNEGATYKELMEEFNISSKGTLSFIINKR